MSVSSGASFLANLSHLADDEHLPEPLRVIARETAIIVKALGDEQRNQLTEPIAFIEASIAQASEDLQDSQKRIETRRRAASTGTN